jgi:N-acetylmuramoyl-L-alanine amidase CwlA
MTPIETFIHNNYSKTETLSPRFIIIHETANQNRGANARAHFNYWDKTPSAKSSAHIPEIPFFPKTTKKQR